MRLGAIVVTGGLLLWALARPVAYDFASYAVVSGYAASQWTWLLVAVAIVAAAVAVVRQQFARRAAVANVGAAVIVAATIVWTVRGIAPLPARDVPSDTTCVGNIKALCKLDRALGSPYRVPDAAPPRGLLIAAFAAYGLAAVVALGRRRSAGVDVTTALPPSRVVRSTGRRADP